MPELLLERWVEFGVAGLTLATFAVSIIRGWLVPGPVYDRECRRADRLEDENRRLARSVEDRVVPALVRSSDLLARAPVAHGQRARDQAD